jgi:hypothetical protein
VEPREKRTFLVAAWAECCPSLVSGVLQENSQVSTRLLGVCMSAGSEGGLLGSGGGATSRRGVGADRKPRDHRDKEGQHQMHDTEWTRKV